MLSLIKSLTRNETYRKSVSRNDEISNVLEQLIINKSQKRYMNVPGPVWDRIPRHSNPTHLTKHYQTGLKSIKTQQKVSVFLYRFSPFLVIPNAKISQIRLIWYSTYFVWIHYREFYWTLKLILPYMKTLRPHL